jgi:transcription elongation factor Elf1
MSGHTAFEPCPECGHEYAETVDAKVKGYGSVETFALRECGNCGILFGESRRFYGVLDE